MFYRSAGCFVLAVIVVFGASCTKLGEPGPGEQKLALQMLTKTDSIPTNWGKLVSVCSVPSEPKWAQLWLQDDEGIIRIVLYNVVDNYLASKVRIIRRD